MTRRRWVLLAAAAAAVVGWYLFRPERLFINTTVAEAFADTMSATVATGAFHSNAHETKGQATIYRLVDGRLVLRLTEFETSNGPDVQIYLVAASDVNDNETVTRAGFVSLGAMKGNRGDQNYDIPAGIDLTQYRAVTVWCRRFSVNFGTAPLS